jgi:hypothetical protein
MRAARSIAEPQKQAVGGNVLAQFSPSTSDHQGHGAPLDYEELSFWFKLAAGRSFESSIIKGTTTTS